MRARFRDVERFVSLCRECPRYATSWLCPPLTEAQVGEIESYTKARIIALKIVPDAKFDGHGTELMALCRPTLEQRLLQVEKSRPEPARACGLSGRCLHCGDTPCARTTGAPCPHPSLARPSLEAFGFDVTAIASEVLHTPILWERDGMRPAYYMLVGAVFY